MALTFNSSALVKISDGKVPSNGASISSFGGIYNSNGYLYASGATSYRFYGFNSTYVTRIKLTTSTAISALSITHYSAGSTGSGTIYISNSATFNSTVANNAVYGSAAITVKTSTQTTSVSLSSPIPAGASFYIYLYSASATISVFAQQYASTGKMTFGSTDATIITTTLNNQSATSAGTTAVYHIQNKNAYYSVKTLATKITSITKPSKTGYTFGGYYTSTGGGGTQYITSAGAFTNNLYTKASQTLYAKWTANTYTLKIDPNGGTYGGSSSVHTSSTKLTYGGTTHSSITPLPVRTGYTFKGYYTAASGGTQLYNSSGACIKGTSYWDSNGKYCYAGNMTLYAQWTAKSYTFTINPNGGIFGASSEPTVYTNLTYGAQNHYVIAVATRPGYELTGYYTAATGGTKVYDAEGMRVAGTAYWNSNGFYCYDGDLTIYAQWEAAGGVVIFIDNEPKTAIPYVYKDGWKPSIPYVYKNGWKISTGI